MHTASYDDVQTASAALLTRRGCLEWLVEFAQSGPGELTLGERIDQRLALTGVLAIEPVPGTSDNLEVILVSDEEMAEGRMRLRQLFAALLAGRDAEIATCPISFMLTYKDGVPEVIRRYHVDASRADQLIYDVLELLEELAPNVHECPAPKPRSDEICGKWFVGRPDQRFCSSTCQVRLATRELRQRKQPTPRKKRGRPPKKEG